MNIVKKLWEMRSVLRYLHQTIWFNFHYLPFKQAIKLPIFVYKMKMKDMRGKVIIDSENIQRGMITLGFNIVSLFPENGIMWDNHGGEIVFRGKCQIGNDSYLSFGKHTKVVFGDDFNSTARFRCVSYRGITFGKSARIGWDTLIMDTNFHPLYDMEKKKFKKASAPINIGDYNWFGTQCKVMAGTNTPERCIFGMNSIVTRSSEMESYCVMGGTPLRILSRNVMRDYNNDTEEE